MLTGEKPNVVGMLDTAESRKLLEQAAAAEQVVPGTALRSLFAMLRPNNLVYNYLVSGWLMGKSPAPFDVLAWNDDATRTTARFACESSRLAMDGWDGNGPTLLGVKTDFSKITCDSYHVGGFTDHITAWRACYDTAHLVGGADKEMTLIKSGHIQSVVYPADSTRYDRWYGPPTSTDPDEWLKTTPTEKGSWWRPWTEWLSARSGEQAAGAHHPRQPPVPAARPGSRHLRARVARLRVPVLRGGFGVLSFAELDAEPAARDSATSARQGPRSPGTFRTPGRRRTPRRWSRRVPRRRRGPGSRRRGACRCRWPWRSPG